MKLIKYNLIITAYAAAPRYVGSGSIFFTDHINLNRILGTHGYKLESSLKE